MNIKKWLIRPLLAIGALLVLGYVIRSILLPSHIVGLFLDYSDDTNWAPATESPLFEGGNVEFAGYDPVQIAGVDMGTWDEYVIVTFRDNDKYQKFLERIEAARQLSRYHLSLYTPGYEQRFLVNFMMSRHRDDDSVEVGKREPLESAIPEDPRYRDNWRQLFVGDYRGEVVLLNFIAYKKDFKPAEGVDSGAKQQADQYTKKATRILGRMGAQVSYLGGIEAVVVGPDARRHDEFGLGHYPSVDAFETVFTSSERLAAEPFRSQAADAARSSGYWLKPYDAFKIKNKRQ